MTWHGIREGRHKELLRFRFHKIGIHTQFIYGAVTRGRQCSWAFVYKLSLDVGTGYTSVFTSQKKIYPALHLRLMYFSLGSYTPVKFLLKFVILRQFVILLVNTNLVSTSNVINGRTLGP